MAHNTIAIIADCDDTLAPDTTGQLLDKLGGDSVTLFREAADLVRAGWDPVLAYLRLILVDAQKQGGPLASLNLERIQQLAKNLEFYPGVPECFDTLKEEIESREVYRNVGIRVETYVVSSALEELLKGSGAVDTLHEYDLSGGRP